MNGEPETIMTGSPMPVLASIAWKHDHVVALTWAGGPRAGLSEEVDLGPAVRRYRAFAPLRALDVFAAPRLIDEGNVVAWGDVEMAVTTIEHLAETADQGRMTAERFRDWMSGHGMTLDDAAAALGVARRLVAHYRNGSKAIPRTVALACAGYDALARRAA